MAKVIKKHESYKEIRFIKRNKALNIYITKDCNFPDRPLHFHIVPSL